jgi:hypothetical protein
MTTYTQLPLFDERPPRIPEPTEPRPNEPEPDDGTNDEDGTNKLGAA